MEEFLLLVTLIGTERPKVDRVPANIRYSGNSTSMYDTGCRYER
ncbi:hypothetical protein SAMN04488100_12914 [Alkalibacterium putridalgicola]|uniref:Uncharacterized protein n=1 Tax=Alkalibacterium putridalgicola TaxID=426703 RepID=A0A1H7W040_9LACT|nr:hypothetical protein APU01nite_07120 [Alkalibacterium putridalgicola]SEM14942.1 hypothetical protein SAMN04488100_12914 [Alkalibacterium putridalgicola]